MLGVALNLGRRAILDRDQDAASVRTIVRTRSMDDLLHRVDYKWTWGNSGQKNSWKTTSVQLRIDLRILWIGRPLMVKLEIGRMIATMARMIGPPGRCRPPGLDHYYF